MYRIQYREIGQWYNSGDEHGTGLAAFKAALKLANETHCDVRIIDVNTGKVIS